MDSKEVFWGELDAKLQNDIWNVIDINDFNTLKQSREGLVVLDVSGMDNSDIFANATVEYINISMNDIVKNMNKLEVWKDKTIVVVCKGGPKSAVAATILRMEGYDATFLSGGFKSFKG